jgi:acetylornithine deacetylase/succinyl-diaminopimelate desuccinylase-like protein
MSTATILPAKTISHLLNNTAVQDAFRTIEENALAITTEQIAISSIPAPPFGEHERAVYLRDKFRSLGLGEATIDNEGNCLALRQGRSLHPLLVVSAHLDTVFPAGTDFTIRTNQGKLLAPGISDDGCGLAALIALAQVFEQSGMQTEGSLLFVGTVGEEGSGNLRGVRYLFTEGDWQNQIDSFLSFDGPGVDRVINGALGSKRYHVELRGIGGHSWGDFGVANPIHALGRAISRLLSYPLPTETRTTFNIGLIEGGTSVNAIPREATMEVDLRSEGKSELQKLDVFFRRVLRDSVDEENSTRRQGDPPLELHVKLLGERPTGETPEDVGIVEIAQEATRALGIVPHLDRASTDSNLPISLGIPAVTLGAGGKSGNSHTLDEWYDPEGRDLGLKRGLLVILGMVGLRDS